MKSLTYLDYNATCPIRAEVTSLVLNIMGEPLNGSAVHSLGRKGRQYIEKARAQLAKAVHADTNNVIFNSGATEANNTVLKHFEKGGVLVSATEHPSVLQALETVTIIPSTASGQVDLNALEKLLEAEKPALVSIMIANNETGIIQPISEISKLSRKYGAFLHCDGVQALGRIEINMMEMGIDFLSISAHKIGGPQGVGALILGLCGETPTLLNGGGQEKKARAGTENIAGIAGFGLACEIAEKCRQEYTSKMHQLRTTLASELIKIKRDIFIYGQDCEHLENTLMFHVPNISSQTILMALDLDGICVSNGSACTSGTVKPSHVLKAMGASDEEASSAIRISMGWSTQEEDLHKFIKSFKKICDRI